MEHGKASCLHLPEQKIYIYYTLFDSVVNETRAIVREIMKFSDI